MVNLNTMACITSALEQKFGFVTSSKTDKTYQQKLVQQLRMPLTKNYIKQ